MTVEDEEYIHIRNTLRKTIPERKDVAKVKVVSSVIDEAALNAMRKKQMANAIQAKSDAMIELIESQVTDSAKSQYFKVKLY